MAVMMNPREKWTDERLDDLNEKVDRGFADLKAETKEGFTRVETNSSLRFKEVDRQFEEVNSRLDRLDDGFFALNRTLVVGGFAIIASLIGSTATLAAIALS
jgi:tetrahydromethanopterin S-methyltransferase subunit G